MANDFSAMIPRGWLMPKALCLTGLVYCHPRAINLSCRPDLRHDGHGFVRALQADQHDDGHHFLAVRSRTGIRKLDQFQRAEIRLEGLGCSFSHAAQPVQSWHEQTHTFDRRRRPALAFSLYRLKSLQRVVLATCRRYGDHSPAKLARKPTRLRSDPASLADLATTICWVQPVSMVDRRVSP